jgi:hypothetical protein
MLKNHSILAIFLSVISLGIGFKLIIDLGSIQVEKQELKYDYSKLIGIQYGLLDINKWKERAVYILDEKVSNFTVSKSTNSRLKETLERTLHTGIEEIEDFLKQQQGEGGLVKRYVKRKAYNTIFDAEAFHEKVPELAVALIQAMNNDSNRNKVKEYLKEEINNLIGDERNPASGNEILQNSILKKYDADDISFCKQIINLRLEGLKGISNEYLIYILSSFGFCFMLWFFTPKAKRGGLQFLILSLFCIAVLLGGILFPMIDIDARITELDFTMLGENISFGEQSIFFQSKSILGVVEILLKEGGISAIGVGVLILIFSIGFPLLKILFSIFIKFKNQLPTNKVINFFVFKSAKWSMADVFIVAIFMAYIGFKNILNSQIESIGNGIEDISVLATDKTNIQEGFILFFSFVVASLVLSEMLKSSIIKRKA